MGKINEVSVYLLERGWYGRLSKKWDKETNLITFENTDFDQLEIWTEFNKKTKEVVKVSIDINLEYNHCSDVYSRKDLEKFIDCLNIVKKALDKLENELINPMCEKFNLPFVDEENFKDKYDYLDVRGLEEYLK